MMKSLYYVFIFISLSLGLISFVAGNNYILSIIISGISLIFFIFLIIPKLNKYQEKINKYRSLHTFINSFIMSISITESIDIAYLNAKNSVLTYTDIPSDLNQYELNELYPFNTYKLFIDVLRMWEEEGGDILKQSEYLLKYSSRLLDFINNSKRYSQKTLVDFIALWVVSLSILIFIRFALKDFYGRMVENIIYLVGIGVVILILLFSVFFFTQRATSIDLNMVKDYE